MDSIMINYASKLHISSRSSFTTATITNQRHRRSSLVITAAKRRYPTNFKKSAFQKKRNDKNNDSNNNDDDNDATSLRGLLSAVKNSRKDSTTSSFSRKQSSSFQKNNTSNRKSDDRYNNKEWQRQSSPSPSSSNRRGFSSKRQQQSYMIDDNDSIDSDDDAILPPADLSDTEVAELLGQDTSAPDPLAGTNTELEQHLNDALSHFAFPLDPFQVKAVRRVIAGRSVTVCAPTGAGKTAIAEAAAIHILRNGGKVIYTTPLKALSNQKLREMRERFGVDAVGLQTGDASINADASIVVMTTEILRNMLYRTEDDEENNDSNTINNTSDSNDSTTGGSTTTTTTNNTTTTIINRKKGVMSAEERLADVSLVVFDECHYLGDPGRGSVWEESIIAMPKHITILAMSATVRNPQDLSGWISAVHAECDTIMTSFRPVPLQWLYCVSTGNRNTNNNNSSNSDSNDSSNTTTSSTTSTTTNNIKMIPLLDDRGKSMNPELLPPAARQRLLAESLAMKWSSSSSSSSSSTINEQDGSSGGWDSLSDDRSSSSSSSSSRTRTLEELISFVSGDDDYYYDTDGDSQSNNTWHSLPRWQRIPTIEDVVKELQNNAMLPAIWFIFSRKDCDAAVARLHTVGVRLTTDEERDIILQHVQELRDDQPEAVKEAAVQALASGLAAHHAGCLPAWKSLIERLFQQGCIKVVFATETLAAGINMPAKTTLLSALSRRRDGGISALTHNELLQMAGRAGRRGYDTLGHCIIVQSKWEDPEFAYDILRKGPEPLRSQFTTNYGMALNLLWSRSMDEARDFLDRSYLKYLGGDGAQRIEKEIERLESKAKMIMDEAARRMPKVAVVQSNENGDDDNDDSQEDDQDENTTTNTTTYSIDDVLENAEDLWVRYQKLQGRRREEKRAARMLRAQLAEERGFIVDATLAQIGLPCVVGLDLSGSNIDDTPYRLTALAVKRLDMNGGWSSMGIEGATYLCLGSDNMLYAIGAKHISAVLDTDDSSSDSGSDGSEDNDNDGQDIDSISTKQKKKGAAAFKAKPYLYDADATAAAANVVINHATTIRRSSWQELAGGALSAEGTGLTAAAVISQLPLPHLLTPIQPSPEGMEALRAQRVRVNAVKSELEALRSDKNFAKTSKRYSRAASKAGVLLDRAAALRDELEERMNGGWKEFESIVRVLESAGAFEHSDNNVSIITRDDNDDDSQSTSTTATASTKMKRRSFTALGKVARELRGANELWLAIALTHPALQLLQPPQLAGVVSSLIAQEAFNRANINVAYPPSSAVTLAVEQLEPARAELAALQIKAGLDVPLSVDLRLAGVVEAWASGVGWAEITADCGGLDDGDVARLLMRTVDTLRQAAFCEHLPLKSVARKAASAMDRKPISDLVA